MRLFRSIWRAAALAAALLACMLHFWRLRLRGPLSLEQRARWLQSACQGVMWALGIRCRVEGEPPRRGLVVSNHLSYLDILILSSTMPCFFVSKIEIGSWPFFGAAARAGGTLFLDRASMRSASRVAAQMSERLGMEIPVLLFPEGTSTDGSEVLPFHPRLIDPATALGAPITAVAVRYRLEGGEERRLCWYGDETFLGHMVKTLGARGFSAEARFGEPQIYTDRREAARLTRAEVLALRGAGEQAG